MAKAGRAGALQAEQQNAPEPLSYEQFLELYGTGRQQNFFQQNAPLSDAVNAPNGNFLIGGQLIPKPSDGTPARTLMFGKLTSA